MANEEAPAPEAAPSKPKLPVLIGMVAVGMVIGGGLGAMVLGPMVAKKMGKVVTVAAAADSTAAEGDHGAPAGEAGAEGGSAEASVHLLENLVLNPAGSGGSRFLLLSVAIEASNAAMVETFKARDAELRDLILTSLGVKTVEELTEMTKREQFKTEVQQAIEAHFGKKSVKGLYFPQFVVQ